MTKLSYRNLSLLGLVLMGASAVTAAIMPKSATRIVANGHMTISTLNADDLSCKINVVEGADKCDFTLTGAVASKTTITGVTSADGASTLVTNTGDLPRGGVAGNTLVTRP